MPGDRARVVRMLLPVLVGMAFLAGWEAFVRLNEIPVYVLPGPIRIAERLVEDWGTLSGSLLVTKMRTLSPSTTSMVGPGDWPL